MERWTSPLFTAEVRDGRIYGRGACDLKGGIAAALFALEVLHASGVRLGGDVAFRASGWQTPSRTTENRRGHCPLE